MKIKTALISVSDKENLKPLLNVPPELIKFILLFLSTCNKDFKLDLSETEIKADLIFLIIFF